MKHQQQYHPLLITLHWLMVVLFILTYASMELRSMFERGSDGRALMRTAHYLCGLSIFFLFWLRVLVRNVTAVPTTQNLPLWQSRSAALTHGLLYVLMCLQPLLGWLLVSAEDKVITIFGVTLPALISENADTAHLLEETHEIVATIGYVLIGLHTCAALFHYYVRKDNVLAKMGIGASRDRD